MSAVCGSCGALIDTATPEVQLIEAATKAQQKLAPLLPFGQRGKLFGTDYEVIGFVARADKWSQWSEYLLFNPWRGFRWLVSYRGHWSFVTRLPSMPDQSGKRISADGRTYKLYAEEEAKVSGVLGEFYWKVRRDENAMVSDYIAPPNILSREFYPAVQRSRLVARRICRAPRHRRGVRGRETTAADWDLPQPAESFRETVGKKSGCSSSSRCSRSFSFK